MTHLKTSIGRQDPSAGGTPVLTYAPLTLPVPGRLLDMQMKVSFPATGDALSVIVISHGHGRSHFLSSMRGYAPLADYFSSRGFVVIQPTHLSSSTVAADVSGPEMPLFVFSRANDIKVILDRLDEIVSRVPGLSDRVDTAKVAAIGHSLGGHTVAMLSGMRVVDPATGQTVDMAEPRLKARVMIGLPGHGKDLAPFASEHYPVLKSTQFEHMSLPALVVNGDKDKNPAFSDREDWREDAYHLSPGPKSLLRVLGAEHIFGGLSGYDVAETTDVDPERVAFVRESIMAYIRSAMDPGDTSWQDLRQALASRLKDVGQIESK